MPEWDIKTDERMEKKRSSHEKKQGAIVWEKENWRGSLDGR